MLAGGARTGITASQRAKDIDSQAGVSAWEVLKRPSTTPLANDPSRKPAATSEGEWVPNTTREHVVSGTRGGSYGGVLQAQAMPVPESETWAMILVGLGLVGLRLSKNNRKEGRLLG
jgi:lysozyme family protein